MGWTSLLAQGVELAQATVALPRGEEGDRWRASVAPLVECQALRLALASLDRLPLADRGLARDLASASLRAAAGTLDAVWRGVPMPEVILEIATDAERALARSAYAGLRMLLSRGGQAPFWLEASAALESKVADAVAGRGTLAMMPPGTLVLVGSPIAWWSGLEDPCLAAQLADRGEVVDAVEPLQVYRQIDDAGRIVGDLISDLDALPAGMPLLVPRVLDGRPVAEPPHAPEAWRAMQERALAGRDPATLPLRRRVDEEPPPDLSRSR